MAAGLQSSAKRVGVHMCEGCMSPKGPRGGPSRDNGANMALGEKCGGECGPRGLNTGPGEVGEVQLRRTSPLVSHQPLHQTTYFTTQATTTAIAIYCHHHN